MKNNFLLPTEAYQRAIDPIGDWIKQTALYASRMLNKPYEECVAHLRNKLKSKALPIKNPTVVCYERGDNGDREKKTLSLASYLRAIRENNEIQAPTLTTYLHPSEKQSVIVEYLDENVAVRKKYKKTSQKYESEGNMPKYRYYNNAQDSAKRANNSVSGGFVSDGSVIQNPSAHSTLTSTTRSISSLSNASNERLIEGNRHYFRPQIVLNNLLSIMSETDHVTISEAIHRYQLCYPSVEQTMECITRSTEMYFRDQKGLTTIKDLVQRMSPVERASVVYTGDLYHLRVFNDAAIRTFIQKLSRRGDATPVEDVYTKLYQVDEQYLNYAHQVCISLMEGRGKDYPKMPIESCYILYNTCQNIVQTVEEYALFIKAFFLTKNSPATIATLPSMIRRSVVLSDTDSTMFATDNWLDWYFGGLRFDDEGYAVGGAIMFMATQAIVHILALFSANMNVERSRLHTLAMKPEYVFPVFAQTPVAKHYYTAMKVKEGNVYKDIKMEIKGVHMKDSSVPTNIIKSATKEMENIIRSVMAGKPLSITDMIRKTIAVEKEILRSVEAGETTYLKRIQIKEASAYKLEGGKSPYQYYILWVDCFQSTYGETPPPPYNAVRIPLNLPNGTALREWLANCENKEFVRQFQQWMQLNNKNLLSTIPLPTSHCESHGVPAELKPILDSRNIVLTLTKSYRNILGSLGFATRSGLLIMDQVHPSLMEGQREEASVMT